MTTFSVTIERITAIEPHPTRAVLEVAVVGGQRSIVKKGQFQHDNLVAHIPKGALIPAWLLARLNPWDAEAGAAGSLIGGKGVALQSICYPVGYTDDNVDLVFGEPDPFHYVSVDKSVYGVVGFVVREGDNIATWLKVTAGVLEQPAIAGAA